MVQVRVSVDAKKVLNNLNKAPRIVQEEAVKMAAELAEFGELEMKANILTSGTPFSDRAREAGINSGPGRFRTGAMYNAVKSRVRVAGNKVLSEYGWLSGVKNYFKYQEYGFRNRFIAAYTPDGKLKVRDGSPVIRPNPFGGYKNTPGMFSLRDSAKSVEREMPRFLKKYRAAITRRINRGEA